MAYNDRKDPRQGFKSKNFSASFEFAWQGLKTAFQEERNFRSHCLCALVAVVAGFCFRLTRWEWLWLLLAIVSVIVLELLNTVAENLVDLITNYHFHPLGKKVKDMAAGAVFVTAGFALLVGLLIFIPKIWHWLF